MRRERKLTPFLNFLSYVRIKILERDDIDIVIRKDGFKTYSTTINLKSDQNRTRTYQLQKNQIDSQQIVPTKPWVHASPARSCSEVCASKDLVAVTSSQNGGGYDFHVCRGYASNGERRPGFNIETSSDSARLCLFEYGGGRGQSGNYDCLCLPDRL